MNPAGRSDLGVRVSIAGTIVAVPTIVRSDQACLNLFPWSSRSPGLMRSSTRRAALALPVLGRPLPVRAVYPAVDDHLRPRIDVPHLAVVIRITMPLVESSECVLLR